jgi:proton glutamate symport protein
MSESTQKPKPWYRNSTTHIFLGLALGVVLGGFFPQQEHPQIYELFRFFSKAFIALIKSVIVPILMATIVSGIAQTGDVKAVGRMGVRALVYFEIVTTLALIIGLVIANTLRPGDGLPLRVDAHTTLATPQTGWETALHAFPSNFFKHAAEGDILPVVMFATLFGIALTQTGSQGKSVLSFFEGLTQVMFRYTRMVMSLTPLGVFGAMAYNVSHMASGHEVNGHIVRGWAAVGHLLAQYARVVGSLYLSLACLFGLVFVPVMLLAKIPVMGFLRAIREPAVTAFSTASSEAALPKLLEQMVKFGVPRRVASFVIPAGYSFNLDGSTLYLVLASMTIAQAANHPMSLTQQVAMMLTFMLTSKGVAGVPRATLVIIAGTCASFNLPGEAGVAMLLAVDEVMDMARTAINVTGNGLASVVISRWEGNFGSELESPETAQNSEIPHVTE